ncbi:transcriptional repressor CTCFL isoform X2 [Lingula anatina]|nr:transcriptional repressor CTCFL isoform X2 [Lingula anatina]XP_013420469.1 transcriptional repressor CTCFL isoform X2 [Lingula anatina]XP_013420470.1 transcriptional repressor CTCFL isoform X2 [Lingula anatina]XP_013420471.1 transcriptional repressor CTCFL isoform X2 [Lingula anatina]|eukprot:XP_013420468.1 transcriptional repressor CTCFL isoform X2 [Lingula anatina]
MASHGNRPAKPQKIYNCPHCTYQSEWRATFRHHLSFHTRKAKDIEGAVACPYCPFKTSNMANLNRHTARHTGLRNFESPNGAGVSLKKCQHCSYVGSSKTKTMRKHIELHLVSKGKVKFKGKLSCSYCPFSTDHQHSMSNHLQHHPEYTGHKIVQPVTASSVASKLVEKAVRVQRASSSSRTKVRPQSSIKVERTALEAEGAKVAAGKSTELGPPVVKARRIVLRCDQCPYKCRSKKNMCRHMEFHMHASQFECAFCTYSCKTYNFLAMHMKVHYIGKGGKILYPKTSLMQNGQCRGRGLDESGVRGKENGPLRPVRELELKKKKRMLAPLSKYHCDLCPFATKEASLFVMHQDFHRKPANHQCPYCTYKVAKLQNLTNHINLHFDWKKFRNTKDMQIAAKFEYDLSEFTAPAKLTGSSRAQKVRKTCRFCGRLGDGIDMNQHERQHLIGCSYLWAPPCHDDKEDTDRDGE